MYSTRVCALIKIDNLLIDRFRSFDNFEYFSVQWKHLLVKNLDLSMRTWRETTDSTGRAIIHSFGTQPKLLVYYFPEARAGSCTKNELDREAVMRWPKSYQRPSIRMQLVHV